MAPALTAPARGSDSPLIETGLLSLKGRRASSRPRLVPRERLVRQLAEARDIPVALLIAPAGYGKTTLISEWAARDERPFAWVTLDEADNDPTTLLSAIALALDAVEPLGWEVFEALSSKRADAATVALQRLARALSARELPCVLALDDVHTLKAAAARRSVIAIGQSLLPGSQLVLAGRSDSALPVGRMRAQGSSLELTAEQLAMTRSEAAGLMRPSRYRAVAGRGALARAPDRGLACRAPSGGAVHARAERGRCGCGRLLGRRSLRVRLRARGAPLGAVRRRDRVPDQDLGARAPVGTAVRCRARARRLRGHARAPRALKRDAGGARPKPNVLSLSQPVRRRAALGAAPPRARSRGRASQTRR